MQYVINDKYLLVWDLKSIHFYDLGLQMSSENRRELNFRISEKQRYSFIKSVYAGNDPNKIAIVIDNMTDCSIFSWNMEQNSEFEAFNIEKDHQVTFDEEGNLNIYDGDCLIISQQLCKVKSFTIDDF